MLVEWLAPPIFIWDVLDSNLGLETACPDFCSYPVLISLFRQKWDNTSH
jgi:hypothetical protein